MKNIIKESKKVMEFQPKMEQPFNEVETFTKSHQTFFQGIGNDKTKECTTSEIKDYYDNKDFDSNDVYNISKGTTKEDELFDYAEVPSYLKISKKSYQEKDKDYFEMSL